MAVEIQLHCKDHPNYKGQRMPKADCVACWRLYRLVCDAWTTPYSRLAYTIRYFRKVRQMRDRQNGRRNSK